MEPLRSRAKMVGVARIELATPAMSTQCSTTELHAHSSGAFREQRRLAQAAESALESSARGRLEAAVLVLGLEDAVDLGDEVLEVEGLRQQLRARSRASALERHGGEPGDE